MYCVGPVYLVIFCYWVGPVPYLELFGAGPVEKNTLYIYVMATSFFYIFVMATSFFYIYVNGY